MKQHMWGTLMLVVAVALLLPIFLSGDQFLQDRELVEPSRGTLASTSGKPVWKSQVSMWVGARPVAAGDLLFVGGVDGIVYALERDTGRQIWKYKIGGMMYAAPLPATPLVYAASDNGTIAALDQGTGAEKWRVSLKWPVRTTLALAEDTLLVGTQDGVLHGLAASSGLEEWTFKTPQGVSPVPRLASARGIPYSLVGTKQGALFSGADGELYSFGSAGSLRWQRVFSDAVVYAPVVHENTAFAITGVADALPTNHSPNPGDVYFGLSSSGGDALHAVDVNTGVERWTFKPGGWMSARPAFEGDVLYIFSRSLITLKTTLHAVNLGSGKEVWRSNVERSTLYEPIALGNKLYFGSINADDTPELRVIDLPTRIEIGLQRFVGRGVLSAPLVIGGNIFVGDASGYLYRVR